MYFEGVVSKDGDLAMSKIGWKHAMIQTYQVWKQALLHYPLA